MNRIRRSIMVMVLAIAIVCGSLMASPAASAHTYVYAVRCWSQQIQYATHYNGSYIHYLMPMRTMYAYEYWTYC